MLHSRLRCWARTQFGRQPWYRCEATRKPSVSGSLPRAKLAFSKIGRPGKGGAKTGDEGGWPLPQQSTTPQEKLPRSLPSTALTFKKSKPYCWKTASQSMKTVSGFLAEPADRWAKNTLVAVGTHPAPGSHAVRAWPPVFNSCGLSARPLPWPQHIATKLKFDTRGHQECCLGHRPPSHCSCGMRNTAFEKQLWTPLHYLHRSETFVALQTRGRVKQKYPLQIIWM